jgi:hypothetical protein
MQMGKGREKKVIVRLNIGLLFDITTGRWIEGDRGEKILTGGLAPFTGAGAPPNYFKTTLLYFFIIKAGMRYNGHRRFIDYLFYDTENSADILRMNDFKRPLYLPEDWSIADYMGSEEDIDEENEEVNVRFFQKIDWPGDVFWDEWRKYMAEKISNKKIRVTLPWKTAKGQDITIPQPDIVFKDSMTELGFDNHEKKIDKGTLGSNDNNMEAMDEMRAKTQMVRRIPSLTASSGCYSLSTAHVGKEHQLDPYAPKEKKLMFLKGNDKFTRVPKPYTFLTQDLYYIYHTAIEKNSGTKGPEYPTKRGGDYKDSAELIRISIHNTRGKGGPSGFLLELLVSQKEGILEGLTLFDFCKSRQRWGLVGNDKNYACALIPGTSLQRTTVRDKIYEDPRQTRAWKILAEMKYMQMDGGIGADLVVPPEELYENMKKLGYDWNDLLDTRDYWLPLEWEKDKPPYMSTLDLLEINAGIKEPYWKK